MRNPQNRSCSSPLTPANSRMLDRGKNGTRGKTRYEVAFPQLIRAARWAGARHFSEELRSVAEITGE
jgi:hypothetical protein